MSVLRLTASDDPFGILWPLYCLSFDLRLLITPLVSCGHCIVCPSTYGFWLSLWFLVAIVLSVLRLTSPDYLFGILWPLCCLSFDLRFLMTPLVFCGHCVVCPSTYGFWLPLWYLVAIVLSVLRLTASDYPFGFFKLFLQMLLVPSYTIPGCSVSIWIYYSCSEIEFLNFIFCTTSRIFLKVCWVFSVVHILRGLRKWQHQVVRQGDCYVMRSGINHMWIFKNSKIFWITLNQDLSLRYPPSKLSIFQLYIPSYSMTN